MRGWNSEKPTGLLKKAQRFLASAELLIDSGDLDSAVSRTYYALFFMAAALLEAKGFSFSSHKAVISAFGQHFAKTGELPSDFHRLLISGFEKRQMGDYLAETFFTIAEVSEMLEKSKQFLMLALDRLAHHF